MTREEAIKHLKLMQSGARNAIRFTKNDKKISEEERKEDIEIYQDQLTALNMATNALEQEPIDTISRQAVVEFVEYIQSIKDKHNDEGSPINYGTICDLVIRGWKLVERKEQE